MSSPLFNQAKQEFAAGRLARALELLTTAPDLHDDPEALQLLAVVAMQVGQGDRALQAIEDSLGKHPERAKLHALAAAVAHASDDPEGARRHAERAFALDPGEEIAASILVEQLAQLFEITAALSIAAACLQRNPDAWGVRLARVFAWMSAGEAPRAMEDAEFARSKAPQSMPARQNAAMCALYLDEPADQTLTRHRSVADDIRALPGKRMAKRAAYAGGSRPLRVGFVSPDLRRHPVGLLMAPLVQHLDPQRIHAIAYSDGAHDAHSAQLQQSFAQWRDSKSWTDASLHDEIQHDGVDILIDLAGYSNGGRPALFATRNAPLQLGYLGHLHATALAAMDGVIGDRVTLPEEVLLPSREAALCLPGHQFCFEPDREATSVQARGDGPIRFGSFNHLAKLSPATVKLWARLLQDIPESTLSLSAMGLSDESVRSAIWARFKAAGIEPERLLLLPPELDIGKFLARYDDIDVALDPLPFNGGMTSLQALWQGVPVLTLPGERMAARMGASVMQTLALDGFVATDNDDFLRIASGLANDPDGLAAIRSGLRDRMRDRGLLDGAAFADGFMTLLESAAAQRLH